MHPGHPFYNAALDIVKDPPAFNTPEMKRQGVSRHTRRRLFYLTRKKRLTVHDLPLWLIARLAYGA